MSVVDGVLLLAAGAAAVVWHQPGAPGPIIITVVGHFFVFCNVVRLRRALELVWAAAYLCVASAVVPGHGGWAALLAICPVTAVVVMLDQRRALVRADDGEGAPPGRQVS